MENKDRINEEINRLNKIIDLLQEKDAQTEDIIKQINFLEDLKFKVECMYDYDDNVNHFTSKFEEEKNALEKCFHSFISKLNENLGYTVQNIFFIRDKLKKNLELSEKNKEIQNDNLEEI